MAWLKRGEGNGRAGNGEGKSRVRRDSGTGRFMADADRVVTRRDFPGHVTSRTIRNDVYEDALRAAETTLRNASRKR